MQKTTVTRQPTQRQVPKPPVLVVLLSPVLCAGDEIPLSGKLLLGREQGRCTIGLDDPAVSRRHARIEWHVRHGLAQLDDEESKNGTFVNGLRTARRYLKDGDVIRVGDSLFAVKEGGGKPNWPAEPIGSGTLQATFPIRGGGPPDEGLTPAATDSLREIVGTSTAISDVRRQLALAARGDLPLLLLGETGTGKDLAAKAVHALSGRAGRFEAVNCSAIPEQLFESIFFGHRQGAFTGATEDSPGLLRLADKGTLFLDEVGELPASAQPKLLRFIEDGIVRPVGGSRHQTLDVRVVAATNADLKSRELDGSFRSDLLARLYGVSVTLPPLRKRRADVLLLARHFAAAAGHRKIRFEPDAAEALLIAPWKRNIRELRLLVARWAQMVWPAADSGAGPAAVRLEDLPAETSRPIRERGIAPVPPEVEIHTRPDRSELLAAIEQHDGNIKLVAQMYGKHRKQVYRWMERLGIDHRELE